MWMKTLLFSGALALGSLAVPASADDGIRIVVSGGGHYGDHYGRYDRFYVAHRYRHYVRPFRPFSGYRWTQHHRYVHDYRYAPVHIDLRGRHRGHLRWRGQHHGLGDCHLCDDSRRYTHAN